MEKEIRTATLGIAEEFRKMEVGDVVRFPLVKYKYTSVRVAPSACFKNEQILEGRTWKSRIDNDDKSIIVTRVS